MDVQATPLAHETRYYLDGASEEFQISGATHAALVLFGDRMTVSAIVEKDHGPRAAGREARNVALDDYAHALMVDAPPQLRDAWVATGLLSSIHEVRNAIDCWAGWNLEDSTIGGGLLPFRKVWRCDDDYNPTPRLRRRLHAPSAIRGYIKRSDEIVPAARRRADRFRRLPWPSRPDAADGLLGLFDRQKEEIDKTIRRAIENARWRTLAAETKPLHRRGFTHQQRRAIGRAAAAAVAVLGVSAVSAFAAGQPVEIRARDVVLQVARGGSLADHGHGALDIGIATPDGARLAKLCFFIDKTPALDQLAAVAMFVAAGEERRVLDTGNLYAIASDAYRHPVILQHLKAKAPRERDDYQRRRAAVQRYTAATFDLYFDAGLSAVWRQDAHRLRRWAGDRARPQMQEARP